MRQLPTSVNAVSALKTITPSRFHATLAVLGDITIQRPKLCVAEDRSADPRFSSPSRIGRRSGARFSRMYQIETPEGLRIGVLCLINSTPHQLDASGILAERVMPCFANALSSCRCL